MQIKPWQRTCDMCGSSYDMNNKEIPRIVIVKKIDVNDLTSKDFIATPDYCFLCTTIIMKFLQKKTSLNYKIPYYSNKDNIYSKILNQST